MDWEILNQIKRIALKAIASDDDLMDRMILKGGSALDLIHKIAERSSIDLDFSIEDSFDDNNLSGMEDRLRKLLGVTFKENNYIVFDVKLRRHPGKIRPELESFWGGYKLTFKVIPLEKFLKYNGDIEKMRKDSTVVGMANSRTFSIDISRFEHCPLVEEVDLDGLTMKVYAPELIAMEKLRSICQQMDEYKTIVPTNKPSARARDFFDIFAIMRACDVDLLSSENRALLQAVFEAKRVPLEYLKNIEKYREFHRLDFNSVKDTLKPNVELEEYDVYFDFVKSICEEL